MSVITLPKYGGREGEGRFRTATAADRDLIAASHHIWYKGAMTHDARRVKVNGKMKLWKRSPERFRIPVKYGLKECFYIDESNVTNVLIEVAS